MLTKLVVGKTRQMKEKTSVEQNFQKKLAQGVRSGSVVIGLCQFLL